MANRGCRGASFDACRRRCWRAWVLRAWAWRYAAQVGLVISEFEPCPELRGVVRRAADYYERSAPLRRLEGPFVGVVMIFNLGPDMEIDGQPTGSFVAGVWDRPTVTGHYGEKAGYQLNLGLLGARRLPCDIAQLAR